MGGMGRFGGRRGMMMMGFGMRPSKAERLKYKKEREAKEMQRQIDCANEKGDSVRTCFLCGNQNPGGTKIVLHTENKYSSEKYKALGNYDFV